MQSITFYANALTFPQLTRLLCFILNSIFFLFQLLEFWQETELYWQERRKAKGGTVVAHEEENVSWGF